MPLSKLLIPHLAIPCRDLEECEKFYVELGCEIGRKLDTSLIINFFGGVQLVPHMSSEWTASDNVKMYPRHFGVILSSPTPYEDLDVIWNRLKNSDRVFEGLFTRNEGKFAEHRTFFILDPSNNLIEFKAYKNESSIFGRE
jgi:extradiol dioxygenase family protein